MPSKKIITKNKVFPCEICNMTFDGTNKKYGQFILCNKCYNLLKIPSKKALLNQKKKYEALDFKLPTKHPERGKTYFEFAKGAKIGALHEYIKWTLIVKKMKRVY